MYLCSLCLNTKHFKEQNLVETELTLDEAGEVVSTSDSFVVCETVICGQCGASSEDGYILNPETLEPIDGGLI